MNLVKALISRNFVLTFHKVFSQQWFEDAILAISKIYRFISAQDIEEYYYNNKHFNSCCHLCFDDGDRSFYDYAFPVLKRMNIPATLFVSPQIIMNNSNYWFQDLGYILSQYNETMVREVIVEITGWDRGQSDKYIVMALFKSMRLHIRKQVLDRIKEKHNITITQNKNITKEQLCQVCESGIITCGAHTVTHPILSVETDAVADKEIGDSFNDLSSLIGKEVRYFAYPNGIGELDYNKREIEILKKYKASLAFSTNKEFFGREGDPFAIPRFGLAGIPQETATWITNKMFLLPVWDKLRSLLRRNSNEMTEERQRVQLQGALMGGYGL